MSEIEKLYKNAGIKKVRQTSIAGGDYPIAVGFEDYPPFTAEKQLAILKILYKRHLKIFLHIEENGDLCYGIKATVGTYAVGFNKDFAECLADFVNCLWQSLTEEEKKQIQEILK